MVQATYPQWRYSQNFMEGCVALAPTMSSVLVIGGTRFIGRHIVSNLLNDGYSVTLLTRGNHDNPFADEDDVSHFKGDRTDRSTIEDAAEAVSPDIVIDSVAFFPSDVQTALDVFTDVDSYIYISSGGAYDHDHVLKKEGLTPLEPCSEEQATDDTFKTYPNRKAEGDRIVFEAAKNGAPALSVRPIMVYGPHNHLEFLQYWIDRVVNNDRILVPGDGSFVPHRTYVEDIASAISLLIEKGEPGEAYNVADQRPLSVDQTIDLISDVADTEVEPVYGSPRELESGGMARHDFPMFLGDSFVMTTDKLSSLGWEATSVDEAMNRTLNYYRDNDLSEYEEGPSIEDEKQLIESLL